MSAAAKTHDIARVIFDFDGTCTQVPVICVQYLARFYEGFATHIEQSRRDGHINGGPCSPEEWREAQEDVRRQSPTAGWLLGGCPAAPAAADPYILADEAAKLILRRRGLKHPSLPPAINAHAYALTPAPWRPEALEVFSRLAREGVRIHIVSNSSTASIEGRLQQLLGTNCELLRAISVESDAGKFRIGELDWDDSSLSAELKAAFSALPAATSTDPSTKPGRPVYLRRPDYFAAICRVLGGNLGRLEQTLFCGDIWEMDLAMPSALGARVHLVERAAPFHTYRFEKAALAACSDRGLLSADLSGVLKWFERQPAWAPGYMAAPSPRAPDPGHAEHRLSRLDFYYKEHAEQARQHENQRERMANIVLGIAGALVGVITFANLAIWSVPAAMAVAALGVYGLLFTRKLYERNRYHVSILREIRREMDYVSGIVNRPSDISEDRSLEQIRECGVAAHYQRFGKNEREAVTHSGSRPRKDDGDFPEAGKNFIQRVRLHKLWEGLHWLILGFGVFLVLATVAKWMRPTPQARPLQVELIKDDTN